MDYFKSVLQRDECCGEMPEWSNGTVSKTVIGSAYPGFESLSLRQFIPKSPDFCHFFCIQGFFFVPKCLICVSIGITVCHSNPVMSNLNLWMRITMSKEKGMMQHQARKAYDVFHKSVTFHGFGCILDVS